MELESFVFFFARYFFIFFLKKRVFFVKLAFTRHPGQANFSSRTLIRELYFRKCACRDISNISVMIMFGQIYVRLWLVVFLVSVQKK